MAAMPARAADPDRVQPIDIRNAEDAPPAHVPGAVHVPMAEFAATESEIAAAKTPMAICDKVRRRSADNANAPVTEFDCA